MHDFGDIPFGRTLAWFLSCHDASGGIVALDAVPVPTVEVYRAGGSAATASDLQGGFAGAPFGQLIPANTVVAIIGAPDNLYLATMLSVPDASGFWLPGAIYHVVVAASIGGVAFAQVVARFRIPFQPILDTAALSLDAVSATGFTLPAELRAYCATGYYMHAENGEMRPVTAYNPATGVGTVAPAFGTVPAVGDSIQFLPGPLLPPLAEADLGTDAISARVLAADAATEIATAVGALTIADGALTEAKFGTDALSARVLKADAVTELQAGVAKTAELAPLAKTTDLASLATSAALAAVGVDVDSLLAGVGSLMADTDDLQTRLPAALVGGKMDAVASVTGLDGATLTAIADAVWDIANKIEPGISPKAVLRVLLAVFAGLSTGVTSGAPVFKSGDVDGGGVVQGSVSRVVGVQDATDQRTNVTLNLADA